MFSGLVCALKKRHFDEQMVLVYCAPTSTFKSLSLHMFFWGLRYKKKKINCLSAALS